MLSLPTLVACFAITGAGQTELLDFTASWCGPCRQMQPLVDSLAAAGHPVRKVDIDQDRALAARFGVTAVPCFVMVVDGQEVDRVVGGTTRTRLEQMIAKAKQPGHMASAPSTGRNRTFADDSPPPAQPPRAIIRGQSPETAPTTFAAETTAQAPGQALPPLYSAQPLVTADPTILQGPQREALAAAGAALSAGSAAVERCLASSVRLKVEDTAGNSVGSGTIIDAREGEALVLTCGHIFRESKGQGKVMIDLFGAGAPKQVVGHVVGFDLKRDVGLVTFRPGVPVRVAKLAPIDYVVKPGARVISVGCDNGREPSARQSNVTTTDKYLPPPNIQVAGQPVEGRSGGGLFTEDGLVIGVCNAADPADDEGLYAGVGLIYGEIARKGLTEMVSPAAAVPAELARDMPAMAREMPGTNQLDAQPQVVPTSAAGPRGALGATSGAALAAPADQALLDRIRAAQGTAEVICIVKPLSDPHAMSQIVVVDQASPQLLQQLSAEARNQTSRRVAAFEPATGAQSAVLQPPPPAMPARQPVPTSDTWQPNTGLRRFR